MRATLGLLLAAITLTAGAHAQSPAPQPPPPQPDAQSTVIQTSTKLVVVDVIVQDKGGNPVRGLKAEDFHLTEDKSPQAIRHFEEHSTATPVAPGPTLPKLPAGTFTNYTPVPPNGTLNILLLDALNTPTKDQSYVRQQLQEYVSKAAPGTRIAIFGLANRLILLQGFSSDPQTLKNAIDHKLIPRASPLLDDPTGSGVDQLQISDVIDPSALATTQQSANILEFEAETRALETQLRVQYTLDAFNTLAHYLAAFPGRKNLVWFSGSFPISIYPDPALQNPFRTLNLNEDEVRETTSLLSKAQVAVYPVDARGLVVPPAFDAASSGRAYARNPGAFSAATTRFNSSQANEHSTMDVLAEETGGHAFYNTNGIADAVSKAINSGANYYSLTYTPSNRREDGSYRTIHVDLSNTPNAQISYRRGYNADDAKKKPEATPENANSAVATNAAYHRAAMSRGAPTPQDLLIKVRVLPASNATETAVAPDNTLDQSIPRSGPFRRYAIDYVALPNEFHLTQQSTGRYTGSIEFVTYVFDTDGRLLNATGKTVALNLTPDTYARFQKTAIQAHLEVSVPTRIETFLRIGIEDVPSNKFGIVEIPVSAISRLPPAVYAAAPASGAAPAPAPSNAPAPAAVPSTPATTAPQPSKPQD